jgi:hypothetical protein
MLIWKIILILLILKLIWTKNTRASESQFSASHLTNPSQVLTQKMEGRHTFVELSNVNILIRPKLYSSWLGEEEEPGERFLKNVKSHFFIQFRTDLHNTCTYKADSNGIQ